LDAPLLTKEDDAGLRLSNCKGGSHPKVFPQIAKPKRTGSVGGQCNSSDTDILMCLTIQALGSAEIFDMPKNAGTVG